MYLTPTNCHWACDIEADDLLEGATTIWCATLINVITKEKVKCLTAAEFKAFQKQNPEAIYIGHNFIAYDAVMLNRFWDARIPASRIVDTFLLSQLYNPSYPKPKGMPGKKGPHSLEAWGIRLKYGKIDFHDFSHFSPEMLTYCMKDTILTALLFRKLTERMRQYGFTEQGIELEHQAWNIIQNKQRRNGFPFDYQRAMELYGSLRHREEELKNAIYKLWPPQFTVVKHYKRRRIKNGTDSEDYTRSKEQYPKLVDTNDGGFDAYDWVAFDLGSPQQRVAKLLELGWEPTQWNINKKTRQKTSPKVDEESLLAFAESSGTPEITALAKWLVVNSRGNMVRTWLDAYNPKTGALHGKLFINSTLRFKHSSPNSANIPAVKTKKIDGKDVILYGEEGTWAYECRDLYTCGDPEQWSLVGIDGKGIQLRVLANYAYSEEFVSRVLDGDPHTNNIKVLGLANKPAAKKFLYTTLMGGGGAKLAVDQAQFGTKLTAKQGNELKQKLIDSVPGFQGLIDKLQDELSHSGRIVLCDGTPIIVPSDHMVIPYLLQGDESRLMKQALVYLDKEIRRAGLTKHCLKVADIHDEWQWRVRNRYVEEFIALALPCFIKAGETFKYRIPIEGDFKVGKTWAQTH